MTKAKAKTELVSKERTASEPEDDELRIDKLPTETEAQAIARELVSPHLIAAMNVKEFSTQSAMLSITPLVAELKNQNDAINGGNLARLENMLLSQAHTLDAIFNHLAYRAKLNFNDYPDAGERFMRLALKAQSNCRASLETIAAIKNPPIVYAKQANIANGPQQVNNAVPPPRTEKFINPANEQSEAKHELLPDTRASGNASGANPKVAALEKVNRAAQP